MKKEISIKAAAALLAAGLILNACGNPEIGERETESQTETAGIVVTSEETAVTAAVTEESTSKSTESQTEITAETTEEERVSVPESETVSPQITDPHGQIALYYLRILNDLYPARVSGLGYGSENKFRAGAFIEAEMQRYGYEESLLDWNYLNEKEGTEYPLRSYVFRKRGSGDGRKIVIGAHYDSADTHGCEDNGTGVSMVMELADYFSYIPTGYDLEFCFWDGEEYQGYAGSYQYLESTPDPQNIILYINLDCLGAGDRMYAYGGAYENDVLVRSFGYEMAMQIAGEYGIDLRTIPTLESEDFRAPTRLVNSDQYYFAKRGYPYVYFEGNAWVDENGIEQHPNGGKACQYNSADPAFLDTEGQINHTKYDDLDVLESIHPGRIERHLRDFSKIITELVSRLDREKRF